MDEAVARMFEGRARKVGCLSKTQARMVVEWLANNPNDDGWEESQVFSHLDAEAWGYGGLVKGKITFFCRCFKDANGMKVFSVEGKRPRKIRFLPPSER